MLLDKCGSTGRRFISATAFSMGAWVLLPPLVVSAADQPQDILKHGAYLVETVAACGNCHTPPVGPMAGTELAGGFKFDFPEFTAYSANITPDEDTGIGRWTDEQIITAIRGGKRPDGSLIGPPMPIELYRQLSDDDVEAMVAYLRTVEPVNNPVPKSEFRIPLPDSYGPALTEVPEVPKDDPVAYGEYLAGPVAHCIECHTPVVNGHRDFEHQAGLGGFEFEGPWGISKARNITADPENGIGDWTDQQIKTAITQGERPDGTKLKPPMPFYAYQQMKSEDLDAIVAYLRTLTPSEQ